ncbi:MAG TPA: hypothetical protein VJ719_01675, partial [Chthoniobacterales bacterium]|nr:hypothetical protein [Chthoniobacterales bacterium]
MRFLTRFSLGILLVAELAGCEKRAGQAIVLSKEYIAAATSPAESPTPNGNQEGEITVDSYVMPGEDRGTGRDPRAFKHEQWLVKVEVIDNGRTFNVPADQSQFDKLRPGDRIQV